METCATQHDNYIVLQLPEFLQVQDYHSKRLVVIFVKVYLTLWQRLQYFLKIL